ncbi:mechanosensitive ion channel family protein [Flavobacterium sp. '19STA2R22 D10 B1']|uniref:mechanosensitive ion channel family protein n=1 Tax=Flavobacterium aerium TaxID=3037261 RepID=UPI00278BB378|nr:mechanosensitive ion channel domain-containing protein [Flavobacterium sp. '19STA2R22 D10 B1']
MKNLNDYLSTFLDALIEYSPRLISAFLILFIGLWAIKFIKRLITKIMVKRNMEPTLTNFLMDLLVWALRILLFVTFISRLGVETSSFVAILGAASLAVGLSLQGSLSNFAGGVLIILFKPFRVGETIETQNIIGTVLEIEIFTTKLLTANNQTVFIPNGVLSNGTIINYTLQGYRRADLTVGISYSSNIKVAKEIALKVMRDNPLVLKTPEPSVIVRNLAASSVDLGIRPWANNADFVTVNSEILEQIKDAYDKAGIEIPFPQSDINIKRITPLPTA